MIDKTRYFNLIKQIFTNGKGVIPAKVNRLNVENYPNICNYLLSVYPGIVDYKLIIHLIKYNIIEIPKCPVCGNYVNIIGKPSNMFGKYCSNSCRGTSLEFRKTISDAAKQQAENEKKINQELYGVDYRFQSKEFKDKRSKTLKEHYGTNNISKVPEIRKKIENTVFNRYGVRVCSQNKNVYSKVITTKRYNGTFNTSKPEEYCYEILSKIYPDIIRQYSSSVYPFNCDFYVPSQDLYIEYNGSWTHGGHFYDANNSADIELLNKWKEKNTEYYDNAIKTWTIRDVNKLNTAIKNDLNYVVLWRIDDLFYAFNIPAIYNDSLQLCRDTYLFNDEIDTYKRLPGKLSKSYTHSYIVKYYQQDMFYKKEKELWDDSKIKRKLIDNRVKYLNKPKEELTTNDILTGFKRSFIYYGYSAFNPMWIKWFHEKYYSKVCYDPCGGWGHRVLGSFNIDKYIYNDLSEGTYNNVCRMIDELHINNVDVYNNDCRDFMPLDDFDTMFTCPPYYNVEEYECGVFVSIDEYNKLIDSLFGVFYQKSSCKVFGMVIREDLLEDKWKHLAVDKFDLTIRGANHMKIHKKYNEALFIFNKD